MNAKLVLNYRDLRNIYLYRTPDKFQMYTNHSIKDGNITYVDEDGYEHFYGLENIFFKAPAEHLFEGTQLAMEMQLLHRDPYNDT